IPDTGVGILREARLAEQQSRRDAVLDAHLRLAAGRHIRAVSACAEEGMAANHEALYGFKREPGLLAQRKCRINNWVDDDAARIGLIRVLCELPCFSQAACQRRPVDCRRCERAQISLPTLNRCGRTAEAAFGKQCRPQPVPRRAPDTPAFCGGAEAFNGTTGLRSRRTDRPYHAFCVER